MRTGFKVKRKSYGMDVVFKVIHICQYERIAILEAESEGKKFFADAPLEDLIII